jgi:GT2 family glycosyltransferase
MLSITAIIVAYNSERLINECVKAALDSGISEIVVWDNSTDGASLQVLEELGDDRVTLHSDGNNHGFGGAINRVLKLGIDGDLVLLINPDCFVNESVVASLRAVFTDPRAGIAAPRMTYPSGAPGIAGGPYPTILKEFLAKLPLDYVIPKPLERWGRSLFKSTANGASYEDTLTEGGTLSVDWVSGFCMMVRSDVLRKLHGFDEDYFLYFEDVDICRRAKALGYETKLAREAAAFHIESTSTSKSAKSSYYYAGLATYLAKHGTPGQVRTARLLGVTK